MKAHPPKYNSRGCPEVNLFSNTVNDTSKKRASPIAGSVPAMSLSVLKLISPSKVKPIPETKFPVQGHCIGTKQSLKSPNPFIAIQFSHFIENCPDIPAF